MATAKQGKARARKAAKGRTVTSNGGEATGQERRADQKAIREKGKAALNIFPSKAIRTAFDEMMVATTAKEGATEETNLGALHLCQAAREYATEAFKQTDVETVLADWKANIRHLTAEMAKDGHKFAEFGEARGDNPAPPKLTGYGRNVASIARGIIEHDVELVDPETDQPADSYRVVRKLVEGARLAAADQAVRDFRDAVSECREAFRESLKEGKKTESLDNIRMLTAAIQAITAEFAAANAEEPEEQEEPAIEEEQEAKKAAA